MITRAQIEKFVSLIFDKSFEQKVLDKEIDTERFNKCIIDMDDEMSVGDLYNAAKQADMNYYNVCVYVSGIRPVIVIHDYSNESLL